MSEILVECYAGHRSDERPLRFVIRGRKYEVRELDGKWYTPEASYFRVRADDGNFYVLRHEEPQDRWTLDGFRANERVKMQQAKKDLRQYQRILVPEGWSIRAESGAEGKHLVGDVSVIGLNGMFIRTRNTQPPGTMVHLKLRGLITTFESDCTIRYVNDHGMGVEIMGIAPEEEQKLKTLLHQLKA